MSPAVRNALLLACLLAACLPAAAQAEVVPEPEVAPAPPEAKAPTESLEAALERETARANQALEQIEQFGAQVEERKRQLAESAGAARAATAAFDARVQTIAGGGRDADRLYEEIVAELRLRRAELGRALDDWARGDAVPRFSPRLDPERLDFAAGLTGVEALRELYARIEGLEEQARLSSVDQRWEAVDALGDTVRELDDIRIEALKRVSPERRRQLLGLTREGVDQVRRELGHLVLEFRLWRDSRVRAFRDPSQWLQDVFAVGSASWILLRVLTVLALYVLVRGRIGPWLEAARRFGQRARRRSAARVRLDGFLRWLIAIGPWALFLAFVAVLRRAAGPAADWPEVDLPLRLLMLYGSYRFAIELTHHAVLAIARRYRLRVTTERTARVLATVRALMRLGFGVALLLTVAAAVLGKGALYHLVLRLAWVLLIGVVLRLVANWRNAIADAYLAQGRGGPLSRAVASSRERWTGTFVALVALVLLAGRALTVLVRDFTLGFDQTRRALAFMFRRKMEKQAEIKGYAEGDVEQLPEAVRKAFSEDPVAGPLRVEQFPGLDAFSEALGRWREDGTGGTFMLTGEYGSGKSSWLRRASETVGESWTLLTLEQRARSPKRLAAMLAEALGLEDVEGDLRALQNRLLEDEPRVIALDRCQNLFLGVVGGFRTFEAFVNLMEATCRNVFWLCAMDAYCWSYLVSVRPDLNVFRLHRQLTPWTEEQIHELIRTRSAACGLEVTYDDLFVERLERIDARDRAVETDRGYTRLLWDYSNGNPRVALHFWLRSLEPDGERRARVRLFRAPDASELDPIGEAGQFLLAALVAHENLTLHEAAAVTRYPVPLCRIRFERLEDLGVLTPTDLGPERVDTHWQRAVLQMLKRRNLIAD